LALCSSPPPPKVILTLVRFIAPSWDTVSFPDVFPRWCSLKIPDFFFFSLHDFPLVRASSIPMFSTIVGRFSEQAFKPCYLHFLFFFSAQAEFSWSSSYFIGGFCSIMSEGCTKWSSGRLVFELLCLLLFFPEHTFFLVWWLFHFPPAFNFFSR